MNLFQWITLPILLGVLAVELIGLARKRGAKGSRLLRCAIWAAAAVAIARPDLPQLAASSVGIHRGADLVLYLFMLAAVAVAFYFYSRYVQLQRQITEVVRHLAIAEAQRGGESGAE
jgi:hypothetical protein